MICVEKTIPPQEVGNVPQHTALSRFHKQRRSDIRS
jgi:hypothetical protein